MSKTIRAVIVDDETLARRGLQVRLNEFANIDVVAEASSGKEAVAKVEELHPDLVFLDIQMPGWNGFDVLKQIKERELPMPKVVFVTAYDQYAIKAFEVRALDYLLKPVDEDRLMATLARIQDSFDTEASQVELKGEQQSKLLQLVSEITGEDCEDILQKLAEGQPLLNDDYPEHIAIKDSGEITRVAVNSIAWIDAAGDYMCIHAGSDTHILRKTMKELEQELNPKLFQRIHRSAIVNVDQVEKLCSRQNGEYHVVLSNGKELKVSRSYKDRIKQLVLGN
ncbi:MULTISPECIES: LytTR family DNA-binding domain-containing protein [Gammaproteobacteria]|uniref:LytR/AlgR family response regulator transcription factor n=1 Tax=Gammaproteobacteria TaxID=1236 RepID=UPI000DD03204|nr:MULTISPECIES: LytTR family DNA-binding domain-containing protein [Gammaproteobacteria]RTE87199.1 response regulator transcription factor [Aliidiomarina sp. B3213]TCZ93013.1 response regulator transcription factor [Lysobacter sp. N42]